METCHHHSGIEAKLDMTQKRLEEDISDKKRIYQLLDDMRSLIMENRDLHEKKLEEHYKTLFDQQTALHDLIGSLITDPKDGLDPRVKRLEWLAATVAWGAGSLIGLIAFMLAFFKETLIKFVKWAVT